MGTPRKASAPSHTQQHQAPLAKGRACSTCKARKVRCSAGTPACQACLRTARFEGRDPDLVLCSYTSVKCGERPSHGGKGPKVKASSPPSERRLSPESEVAELEKRMVEYEKIVRANLKAVAAVPERGMSNASSNSSSSSSPRLTSPWIDSTFTSTSAPPPFASSTSYVLPPLPPIAPIYTPAAQFNPSPLPVDFSWPSALAASAMGWSYAAPASPDSFLSSSSWSDDQVLSPPSPPYEPIEDLPEHFTHTAHNASDTLSLPLFFPLPPRAECLEPALQWPDEGLLGRDDTWAVGVTF